MFNFKVLFFLALIFSCKSIPDDDIINNGPDPVEEPDIYLLDSNAMLWQSIIDTALFQGNQGVFCHYPIIHEDLVVWHMYGFGGFLAYNKNTGKKVWDNSSQLDNNHPIISIPHKVNNKLVYTSTSSVRKIDLNSGKIDFRYIYGADNEFFGPRFHFADNVMYSSIKDFPNSNMFSELAYCAYDELEQKNWVRINKLTVSENDDYFRSFKISTSYRNENDERVVIFRMGEHTIDFSEQISSVFAYNIDQDSTVWHQRMIGDNGGGQLILEDEKLYLTGHKVLFSLDVNTGEEIWSQDFHSDHFVLSAGIVIVDDILVGLGHAEQIIGLNKHTGERLWSKHYSHISYGDEYQDLGGSEPRTANIYNGRVYYATKSGSLMSIDPMTGDHRRFYLPTREDYEDIGATLFEHGFSKSHLTISDDGIVYASDGFRVMAFEVPDKNW